MYVPVRIPVQVSPRPTFLASARLRTYFLTFVPSTVLGAVVRGVVHLKEQTTTKLPLLVVCVRQGT